MTSIEAVKRARSHNWNELNEQSEFCTKCLLIMLKSTNLENVPDCKGMPVIRR